MPRKKYDAPPIVEIRRKLKGAALTDSKRLDDTGQNTINGFDEIESLEERIEKLLGIVNRPNRKATDMLFFVMYDIESNKVRQQIAKYLIDAGCSRIQHSIYLADLPSEEVEKIKQDLTEVQACYDNHDSILVVPISTDYLEAMKVIGKKISVDIIMKKRNTLFF